ncbi:hypothetical protein ACFL2Q_11985 [Thermodesulfobacteriota bacterium]
MVKRSTAKDKKKSSSLNSSSVPTEGVKEERNQTSTASDPAVKSKKRRPPRMTHKEIWLLYSDVLRSSDSAEVFDILARNFEKRSDLGYWLYRAGFREFIALGKGKDLVSYFRAAGNRLFHDTRDEALKRR